MEDIQDWDDIKETQKTLAEVQPGEKRPFKIMVRRREVPQEEYKKEEHGPIVKDQGRLKTKISRIYYTLKDNIISRFFLGFGHGFLIGGLFGCCLGTITAIRHKKALAMPFVAVLTGTSFGFFLGVGTIVRSQDKVYTINDRAMHFRDGEWVEEETPHYWNKILGKDKNSKNKQMEEFKDLIYGLLDNAGSMDAIRSALRSNIFQAIEELHDKSINEVLTTQTEVLVGELIRDFMQFYKVDNSLEMFLFETNLDTNSTADQLIQNTLGLKKGKVPYLIQLIQQARESSAGKNKDSKQDKKDKDRKPNFLERHRFVNFGFDEEEEEVEDLQQKHRKNRDSADLGGSTTSLQPDPSVDQLAIEDYDHMENI